MAVKERIRVGGRSARIQAAVHDAVRELSAEIDRAELTVPLIAARAGVTPSTIYRRWGDLSELLGDVAVERLRPVAEPLDTGSTAGDLEAWVVQYMEEMSSAVGRAMLRDVLINISEGNACQCANFTYEQLQMIADRAAHRGEVPFDVDDLVDRVIGPIMYHVLFGHGELTPDYCRMLLARVPELKGGADVQSARGEAS
ncbi:TetR/AcrR family transcriptional regulator [Kaistia dalseonensis]|nr:TetR/AcrR family transcriptional regulator [Kaistia dalseonensis]MCX5497628.1 TetR/AcrR family transcriptional regulator [Kaistia dalseonensis]